MDLDFSCWTSFEILFDVVVAGDFVDENRHIWTIFQYIRMFHANVREESVAGYIGPSDVFADQHSAVLRQLIFKNGHMRNHLFRHELTHESLLLLGILFLVNRPTV